MILKETVAAAQAGMRLDDGASLMFASLSKTRVRRIVDLGGCTVNGAMVRVASRTLRQGDEIVLGVMEPERFRELVYTAESILYEDAEVVGICKPAGFNSQRTPYQLKGTVEYAIGVYLKCAANGEPVRIIHRLDRGTSGVMLFPKNRTAAARLSQLLKEGRVEKRYLALVTGNPPAGEWLVDQPIAKVGSARYGVARPGKEAQTGFRVVVQGDGAALVEARPLTGRTHQIRVHLEHCGLPIVGDSTYGGVGAARMMLHCRSMSFEGREGGVVTVVAEPDVEYREICGQKGVFGF